MSVLSWQMLVFLIPVGIGSLLAIGAALGLHQDGADGHLLSPADHELGAGDDGSGWLALGRVPLTIRLMLLTLLFGGFGLAAMYVIAPDGQLGGLMVSLLVAALASTWVSNRVARFMSRRVRLLETETIHPHELVGSTGRAVLPIDGGKGLAQVHDRRGNLHQIRCLAAVDQPALASGAELLIVEYDEQRRLYRAVESPTRSE